MMSSDRRLSRRAFVTATAMSPVLTSAVAFGQHQRPQEPGRPTATLGGFTLFHGWLVLVSDKPSLGTRKPRND